MAEPAAPCWAVWRSRVGRASTSVSFDGIERGILGGVLDAIPGSFVAGIGSAVVGAIGVLAGALVVDRLATPSRRLTADEIRYAREVFADSLDYSQIRSPRDNLISTGAAKVVGNTSHLRAVWGSDQFARDARGEFMAELTALHRTARNHDLLCCRLGAWGKTGERAHSLASPARVRRSPADRRL